MPPLLNNVAMVRRSSQYRLLGDFWYAKFKEQREVRLLNSLSASVRSNRAFQSLVYNLAQQPDLAKLVESVDVPYDDVIETGTQVFDDPDNFAVYMEDLADAQTAYGVHQVRYYAVELGIVSPILIQLPGRQLVLGTDFFIQAGKYVFFREHPDTLFDGRKYFVRLGAVRETLNTFQFLNQVAVPGYDDYVTRYRREMQTPEAFRLALCAVGGLQILRTPQALKEAIVYGDLTTYVFEEAVLRVDYEHEPLVVGTLYPENYVVGEGVKMYQPANRRIDWWRAVDWRGGISLAPLLPGFPALNLLDESSTVYVAGQDSGSIDGSKAHVRIRLSELTDYERGYWDTVWDKETQADNYLNQIFGLGNEEDGGDPTIPDTYAKLILGWEEANALARLVGLPLENPDFNSLPQSQEVNALDGFFRAFLGQVAVVLALDYKKLRYPERAYQFLARERPAGPTWIVLGRGPEVGVSTLVVGNGVTCVPVNVPVFLSNCVRPSVTLRAVAPV
jgi:hypothetical protein